MQMDLGAISAGMSAFKAGLDTIKTALSIVKDVKDTLPSGSGKEQIGRALDQATEKMVEGEAAIAIALGYTLCRCAYPPTPMLMVGYVPIRQLRGIDRGQALSPRSPAGGSLTGAIPVHECPKCKNTDAPTYPSFQRTVPSNR
jgi:hypothetical protein